MNRWVLATCLGLAVLCLAWLGRAQGILPDEGFTIRKVRFDDSAGSKPSPAIPKDWKFVAVEHGTKVNETHLWFQDGAGNLYMIQGFTSEAAGLFWLRERVSKIEVER